VRLDGKEEEGWQEKEIGMVPRWGGHPPAVFMMMQIIGVEGSRGIEACQPRVANEGDSGL
jgi:hypothetical protein